MTTSAMRWVDEASEEFESMWRALEAQGFDINCADERSGEYWQYMGTFAGQHEFRHRSLRGQRLYVRIPASEDWL